MFRLLIYLVRSMMGILTVQVELSVQRRKELTAFEAEPIFDQVLQKYELLDDWNSIKSKTIPHS